MCKMQANPDIQSMSLFRFLQSMNLVSYEINAATSGTRIPAKSKAAAIRSKLAKLGEPVVLSPDDERFNALVKEIVTTHPLSSGALKVMLKDVVDWETLLSKPLVADIEEQLHTTTTLDNYSILLHACNDDSEDCHKESIKNAITLIHSAEICRLPERAFPLRIAKELSSIPTFAHLNKTGDIDEVSRGVVDSCGAATTLANSRAEAWDKVSAAEQSRICSGFVGSKKFEQLSEEDQFRCNDWFRWSFAASKLKDWRTCRLYKPSLKLKVDESLAKLPKFTGFFGAEELDKSRDSDGTVEQLQKLCSWR